MSRQDAPARMHLVPVFAGRMPLLTTVIAASMTTTTTTGTGTNGFGRVFVRR